MNRNDLKKLFARIVLIIIMADCFLTLIGQPSYYWQDYSFYDETSAIGKVFLQLHPLVFVLGLVFWVILITFLINKLSFFLSSVLFFALSIGHSFGAGNRIQPQLQSGIEILIGKKFSYSQEMLYKEISNYFFYIILALIFAFVLKKVFSKK